MQDHLPYLHAQQIGLLLKPFAVDALLNGIQELVGGTRDDGETVFVQAAVRSVT
jgi:hypothetical protein